MLVIIQITTRWVGVSSKSDRSSVDVPLIKKGNYNLCKIQGNFSVRAPVPKNPN